jgi:succinate dehydrogenase / fumarate reductase, cytochrome b subunit
MTDTTKKRPEFRNINPLSDLTTYRLPLAGKLSILHRVSGLVMFFLLPFVIWLLDTSISSEFSYARFTAAFNIGAGIFPGWFIKLAVLALITTSAPACATFGWTSRTRRSTRNSARTRRSPALSSAWR